MKIGLWLLCLIGLLVYGLSFFWPGYYWGVRVPSPDKNYDAVALLGDRAAMDDFFFKIYVFPKEIAPPDVPRSGQKFTRIWYAGKWRSNKYLVYSGYDTPLFRWTGPHALEIDLNDLETQVSEFIPVKRFGSGRSVVISLVFGEVNSEDQSPFGDRKVQIRQ